jgi:hypothetical protein
MTSRRKRSTSEKTSQVRILADEIERRIEGQQRKLGALTSLAREVEDSGTEMLRGFLNIIRDVAEAREAQ